MNEEKRQSAVVKMIRVQGQQLRETVDQYVTRKCRVERNADGQENFNRICRYERGD